MASNEVETYLRTNETTYRQLEREERSSCEQKLWSLVVVNRDVALNHLERTSCRSAERTPCENFKLVKSKIGRELESVSNGISRNAFKAEDSRSMAYGSMGKWGRIASRVVLNTTHRSRNWGGNLSNVMPTPVVSPHLRVVRRNMFNPRLYQEHRPTTEIEHLNQRTSSPQRRVSC